MTRSWVKGLPAFLLVAAAVVGIGLWMDVRGVALSSGGRILYAFIGVVLAVAAGVAMARRDDA